MTGKCLKCRSTATKLVRGDDGHYRKHCDDCGHVGGPYISAALGAAGEEVQVGFERWA